MDYRFAKHLLLRMPAGGDEGLHTNIQFFLANDFFRAALYIASPVFFDQISQVRFRYDLLNEKEKHTLRRYINRFCFRPTPFGFFASVSLLEWGHEDRLDPISFRKYSPVIKPDQSFTATMGRELLSNELFAISTFTGNPSLYRTLNEYRFIRTDVDKDGRKREYLLQSTAYSALLKNIISFCVNGKSRYEIAEFIGIHAACDDLEATDYFSFLIDAQLLVNSFRANITGPGYLLRLINAVPAQATSERMTALKDIGAVLRGAIVIEPGVFMQLNEKLGSLLQEKQIDTKDKLSVILKLDLPDAKLDKRYQEQINDGIFALNTLAQENEVPAMKQFIKSFQQHFEGQRLPLLAALDPETGIGYQPPSADNANPLLETMQFHSRAKPTKKINWTGAQILLLETWHLLKPEQPAIIQLDEAALKALSATQNEFKTMGLSILFRITEENVVLESVGGNNAPALMGRFTVAGEAIKDAAIAMARQQEEDNPHVLFAELLHLSDPHIDNVNRRESVWSWELPIVTS